MNRKLGIYVCFVASVQATLYAAACFNSEPLWLFYFDPRIGLFFFESGLRGAEVFPGMSSWASAVILLGLGIGMSWDLVTVGMYLIVEAILAAPTLLFFIWIALANQSPSHGLSVGELFIPIIVFTAASVLPMWLGLRSRRPKGTNMVQISRLIGIICFSSISMSGCTYRLMASNPPLQQKLRIISPDPAAYSIVVEEARPRSPHPVAGDGGVIFDIPTLARGCDVYFLNVIRVGKAGSPFERKAIHLFRGNEVIRQFSLNEMAKLPVDSQGYRLLRYSK